MAKKQLISGKTEIGKIDGKYKGIFRNFTIYYGNVASPVIDNKVLHLNEEDYMNMLRDFLESDEGMEYDIPTGKEVKDTIRDLINQETMIVAAKEEKKKQEEQERNERERKEQRERDEADIALRKKELDAQNEANELKKIEVDSLKKRIKLQRIFLVAMVVLNVLCLCGLGILAYFKLLFWDFEILKQ